MSMQHAPDKTKQRGNPNRGAKTIPEISSSEAALHPVLQLQQTAGNLAVQELLRSRHIQAKLFVGNADDPEEREADQIAHNVMRRENDGSGAAPCACTLLGGEPCEECRKEENTVHRSALRNGTPVRVPGHVRNVLRSPGHSLDLRTRSFMEQRFGLDFSQVRVHTDRQAGEAAMAIGARAFAYGPHIAFAPGQFRNDREGTQLLAHELAHVKQSANKIRRNGPNPPATPAPEASVTAVSAAVDIIIDALEGYTSSADSERVLNQFRGQSAATVLAIVEGVKSRGWSHSMSADQMVDWLLGDLTEENRRELRQILAQSHSPDFERIVVAEIRDRLAGYTSESDSAEIYALFLTFSGSGIDTLLTRLETEMKLNREALRSQLFGDLDRVNAERLRQLFFRQGGPLAAAYGAAWTADKVMDLLAGYTSHSDSTDIVWNFRTTPNELRGLVLVRLNELTTSGRNQPAQDALMHDLDPSDYERLRALEGLILPPYVDTRTSAEKIVSGAEWVLVVAEWTTCGVIGIATGLLSAVWDILKGIKDIVVGVWDLIWSLVYLVSFGAAGSENWLKVKNFFIGVGKLFTDPGKVWDDYWEEKGLEFHSIEGTLSDCRRAEYVVRQFISALVNVALIFVAGYGLAKGAISGVRALAEGAELAEVFGVRAVISVGARLARRQLGRFIETTGAELGELLTTIRQPITLVRAIGTRIRTALIAAEDLGYWRFLREQAGTAVRAGAEVAQERLDAERQFWNDNRQFWREYGLRQQAQWEGLNQDLDTVDQHLAAQQKPEDPATITGLTADAVQLDAASSSLLADELGVTQANPPPSTAAPISLVVTQEQVQARPGLNPQQALAGPAQRINQDIYLVGPNGLDLGQADAVEIAPGGEVTFIEQKDGRGIGKINPKTGKPYVDPSGQLKDFGRVQIYEAGERKVHAMQNAVATRGDQGAPVPGVNLVSSAKTIRFEIRADTPELRAEVEARLQDLRQQFPDIRFEARYGVPP